MLKAILNKLPYILLYSRLTLGILFPFIVFINPKHQSLVIILVLVWAVISDIFDGIIARHLQISSEKFRVQDSNVDLVFWIIAILTIFYLRFDFVSKHWLSLMFVFTLEICTYIICYWKFKRTIATHSILAKFWTLTLLYFLIALSLEKHLILSLTIVCIVGALSRIEIIAIILSLKQWQTDVPSIFAVKKLNNGEKIKKSKLFNS